MSRIVAPSMLSADFGHLWRDTKMIDDSAAEWVHLDIMDGVFVPNISYGFPVVKAIRKATDKFLDVHLMIVQPEKYVEQFVEAGANLVTFHIEATDHPLECIDKIRSGGAKVGISIKPATPISAIEDLLDRVDLVLIMSVEPGFGGQSFIDASVQRAIDLRALATAKGLELLIEMDGGISAENAGLLYNSGCDVLVAGSAVFQAQDPCEEILKMINAE